MSNWRANATMAIVAFGLATGAMAQTLSAHAAKASVQSHLAAAFKTRTARSCAPVSPMQTSLEAPDSGVVGSPIALKFNALLTELGGAAEYRVDVPQGVRLVSGRANESGTLKAKEAYSWNLGVVVDAPGTYEVHVQLLTQTPGYEFGRRETLYITSNGSQLSLTTEKPKVQPVQQQQPDPVRRVNESVPPTIRQRGMPPEAAFTGRFDPYGAELDNKTTGGLGDASATVTGIWRYRHKDGTLQPGYGSWVEAWDDDTVGADDFLGRTTADSAGNFSITFDNGDDLFFGTADVYLVFIAENTRIMVHNLGGTSGYSGSTAVLFPDIGAGTFNAGSWFMDGGTAGVSDASERAYQLCDELTTAWQHWNYYAGINFDNHYTYCQWYQGSTDGAYYILAENRIYCDDNHVGSPDVTMHEYGHSMHDGLFSDAAWPPGSGGSHSLTGHYTTGLAWTEGFATYYSCTAQANDWMYDDNSPTNTIHFNCDSNWDGFGAANGNSDNLSVGAGREGYDTESAVLAFQLDLDDGRNDPTDSYDWMTAGDDEIFDVMRNYTTGGHRPYSVQEFFNGWHSIVNFQNPKINGEMQVHGMSQAINYPELGIYTGVSLYAGTWYYGGYGRGSYEVKNYGSQDYDLNQCYVWLRGPAGQDVGQFGGDGNGAVIPSGATRLVWETSNQTGYNPAAPNFIYGLYTVTAGHYRSDGNWQLLEPAETGTDQQVSVNVVRDLTGPSSLSVADDGANQTSLTTVHITASAVEFDSSIAGYWTRVGSTAGAFNYQDWVFHAANDVTNWDFTVTGLTIPNGAMAYVTVVARNIEGFDSPFAYTDGIKCGDTTPPGPVTVADDGIFNPTNHSMHYTTSTTEPDGGILMWWSRVGTSAGAGDVSPWINYDVHTLAFNNTVTGLTMPTGVWYYVTSVARNYGGQDTFGYSNGILSPLYPSGATIIGGSYFGGSINSLFESDNDKVFLLNDEADNVGILEARATSPVLTGSTLYYMFEAAATRTDMTQFAQMYRWSTNSFVNVDSRAPTLSDSSHAVAVAPATYINGVTGMVQSRLMWIPNQDIDAGDGWTESIDRMTWYVAP